MCQYKKNRCAFPWSLAMIPWCFMFCDIYLFENFILQEFLNSNWIIPYLLSELKRQKKIIQFYFKFFFPQYFYFFFRTGKRWQFFSVSCLLKISSFGYCLVSPITCVQLGSQENTSWKYFPKPKQGPKRSSSSTACKRKTSSPSPGKSTFKMWVFVVCTGGPWLLHFQGFAAPSGAADPCQPVHPAATSSSVKCTRQGTAEVLSISWTLIHGLCC